MIISLKMIMRHLEAGETDGDLCVLLKAMTSDWICFADSSLGYFFLCLDLVIVCIILTILTDLVSVILAVQSIYRSTITITRLTLALLLTVMTMTSKPALIMDMLPTHFTLCILILNTLLT